MKASQLEKNRQKSTASFEVLKTKHKRNMHSVSIFNNLRLYLSFRLLFALIFFFSITQKGTAHYTHSSEVESKLYQHDWKKNGLNIQQKTKKGECIFEFKKDGDQLLITYQNQDKHITYQLSLDSISQLQDKLHETVAGFRKKNIEKVSADYQKLAHQLFITLMGRVRKDLDEKIIITGDDLIKNIPWSTLIKSNHQKPEYLIYDHEIILNEVKSTKEIQKDHSMGKLVIAPDFEGKLWLNYQDKEIVKPNRFQQSNIIISKGKNEIISELNQNQNSIIHFATHNVWNEEIQDYEIILTKDKEALGTSEISELKSSSKLVFINACESAKLRNGKSISGAFLSGPAEATIGTLWKIEDHAASQIALFFYQELSKGYTKSKALRNAQVRYLKSTLLTYEQHPYFWGAYTLEGDDAPLFKTLDWKLKRIYTYIFPLLTTCSMLTFYFGKRIKQRIMFSHFL